MISGLTQTYSGDDPARASDRRDRAGVRKVSGLYILILKDRIFLSPDDREYRSPRPDLAEIALLSAATAEPVRDSSRGSR